MANYSNRGFLVASCKLQPLWIANVSKEQEGKEKKTSLVLQKGNVSKTGIYSVIFPGPQHAC
jgi:hypothetical protein